MRANEVGGERRLVERWAELAGPGIRRHVMGVDFGAPGDESAVVVGTMDGSEFLMEESIIVPSLRDYITSARAPADDAIEGEYEVRE